MYNRKSSFLAVLENDDHGRTWVFTLVCNTKSVESVNLGVSKWRSVWLDSWGGGGGGGWGVG